MIAAFGTLAFLATLWLLVVVGAAVLEESGAKIAAALKGQVAASAGRSFRSGCGRVPRLAAAYARDRRGGAPPLDPRIARQAQPGSSADKAPRRASSVMPRRDDQRRAEQGDAGQREQPPAAADADAGPAVGRQARDHQRGDEQRPGHDQLPLPGNGRCR